MIDAAVKALTQMFSAPLRRVLLKSVGLALVLIVFVSIGLYQIFSWLAEAGAAWGQSNATAVPETAWSILVWVVTIMASLGIVTGAVFLMPAVTAFVGSFFVDEIAELVEREYYPADPPGRALPFFVALLEGLKTGLLTIGVYIVALPFVFVAIGLFVLFFANAYLLGREYFELAAMRFRLPAEARALRRTYRTTAFIGGMFIALFVSIPVLNLATPLFAMAFMVHVNKRLSARRPELTAANRPVVPGRS